MLGAFQSSAFQNSAFQVDDIVVSSLGGPFRKKVLKNNYDRPYLAEYTEQLKERELRRDDDEAFLILF